MIPVELEASTVPAKNLMSERFFDFPVEND